MKIKQKSNKKKLIIVLALLIASIGAYTAIAFSTNLWPFHEKQELVDTTTNDTPSPKPKNPSSTNDDAVDQDDDKKTPYEEEPKEQAPNSTITVTDLKQTNGSVTVSASATNTQNGRCIAYFTADVEGYSISEYMKVTNTNNGISCSVSINELKFTYLGKWNVRVVYTTSQNTKVETTGVITIQ